MKHGASGGPAAAGGLGAAVDRAVERIGQAASWLTLAIAALMAANVLLRYTFSIGSVWSQELEWHLLAPLVLVGMSYALNQGEHVRVDMFYARYSPRAQAAIDLLAALLAVLISLLVIRYSVNYVSQSYQIAEISPDPGGLHHRWLLKAMIPAGFALFAVQAGAQGLVAAQRLRAGSAAEGNPR